MNYRQAIEYVLGFTDWERAPAQTFAAAKFDLRRVQSLLARLGNPHLGRQAIHIAGSKGKGSVAAMIASILQAAGYRSGLYTSPHLHSFRERIVVDGEPIGEDEFARLTEALVPQAVAENEDGRFGQLTTFELLTALAFLWFQDRDVRWQVLEVGMGGRLDATNVVDEKAVCVITPISLEHTTVLGDTVEEIAVEKAAILRPGTTLVMAPQTYPEAAAVIRARAAELAAPLLEVSGTYSVQRLGWDLTGQSFRLAGPRCSRELWLPLLGDHQLENAATAVAAIDALRSGGVAVSEESIEEGLSQLSWPGRLEVLRDKPLIVVDGAHNGDSARRLRQALRDHFSFGRAILMMGVSGGKTIAAMAEELAPLTDRLIATRSQHPRAAEPEAVAAAFAAQGVASETYPTVAAALDRARALAEPDDLICVVGSLFVVAEVREQVLGLSVTAS
ncbi:MAG: bifunctional folylpolyglutamate synthase/dihydrofolate synthase [Dehalococcoidia bacterium]|nr:MAG: bifunctional folylpolyglutamate synthase/dihydrofolate synthase [Dehalococcoidia bacterium]